MVNGSTLDSLRTAALRRNAHDNQRNDGETMTDSTSYTSIAAGPNWANRLVGLADICELMAATWAFPADGALAGALVDGSYRADLHGCLVDAGMEDALSKMACDALDVFAGREANELAGALKRGHSILFMAPGAKVPVWPYEAAFRFVAAGRSGAPSLFRSPIELDVERAMREAGVLPEHARTEPPDSLWGEFGFMAYLLAQSAGHRASKDEAGLDTCLERAQAFARDHMATWVPAFMEKAAQEALNRETDLGREYAALANVGAICWSALVANLDV